MPTTVLIVFSGTSLQLARDDDADDPDQDERRHRGERGEAQPVLGRTEADHDQHHFGALEEHPLEGDGESDGVAALGGATGTGVGVLVELGHGLGVDRVLVVQGLVAARTQDGLAEPVQPEDQEERANDDAQRVDRHVADERDAHRDDEDAQHGDCGGGALERGAPAPAHAGGDDQGQCLDHLDEAGPEHGEDEDEGRRRCA